MMAAIGGKSLESYDEGVKFIEQYAREGFHPLKHQQVSGRAIQP